MTNCEFTTSRGKTIRFTSIAFLLDRFNASHPMPEPPTYEIKTLGGAIETHTHDETTLKTDEDRQLWQQYQTAVDLANQKRNRDFLQLVILESAHIEMPTDDAWEKRQARLYGMQVPSDPDERKLHYMTTEVLGGKEDYEQLALYAMQASGADEEAIAQARALFQRNSSGNSN